jgi:FAD/FMN-containing dehydrogenase
MMQRITRRDLLQQSALAAAAMSLGGLAACRRRGTSDAALRTLDDIPEAAIRNFVAAFRGSVIRPEDAAYAEARRVFNARFDRRPGLIARPVDAKDVATAVDYARAENLATAVRGGGHSYAGYSTCDGGLSRARTPDLSPACST